MKRFWHVLTAVLLVSMVLAACSPAATRPRRPPSLQARLPRGSRLSGTCPWRTPRRAYCRRGARGTTRPSVGAPGGIRRGGRAAKQGKEPRRGQVCNTTTPPKAATVDCSGRCIKARASGVGVSRVGRACSRRWDRIRGAAVAWMAVLGRTVAPARGPGVAQCRERVRAPPRWPAPAAGGRPRQSVEAETPGWPASVARSGDDTSGERAGQRPPNV